MGLHAAIEVGQDLGQLVPETPIELEFCTQNRTRR